jgi:hypothetical protein
MKIEAGKYYRTRDGRKFGPMRLTNPMSEYPWEDGEGFTYTDIGQFAVDLTKHDRDLIAEWTDEPATPKRWRDMTPEEKGALLLARHEGKALQCNWLDGTGWLNTDNPTWQADIVYRIRPESKRLTVDLMADFKAIGTIDLIDGKPDPASIKIEAFE